MRSFRAGHQWAKLASEGSAQAGKFLKGQEAQDRPSEEGQVFRAVGFLAKSAGVFFPQARGATPVVFVFHCPVSAYDGGQLAQSFVPFLKAGDEDPGLAFELFTAGFIPLAGHGEDLARSRKAADLFVKGHDAEQAAFPSSVSFFPSTGLVKSK